MGYVLIVEDDCDVAAVLASWLRRAGHEIRCVQHGHAGLTSALREREPDLVLTDYRMPEMDGKDMIGLLGVSLPQCPVIVLTGYIESTQQAHLELEPNVAAVVAKPADMEAIVRLVDDTLRTSNNPAPSA